MQQRPALAAFFFALLGIVNAYKSGQDHDRATRKDLREP
jgi:hypothetical protein